MSSRFEDRHERLERLRRLTAERTGQADTAATAVQDPPTGRLSRLQGIVQGRTQTTPVEPLATPAAPAPAPERPSLLARVLGGSGRAGEVRALQRAMAQGTPGRTSGAIGTPPRPAPTIAAPTLPEQEVPASAGGRFRALADALSGQADLVGQQVVRRSEAAERAPGQIVQATRARDGEHSLFGGVARAVGRVPAMFVEGAGGVLSALGSAARLLDPVQFEQATGDTRFEGMDFSQPNVMERLGAAVADAGARVQQSGPLRPSRSVEEGGVFQPRNWRWWTERGTEAIGQLATQIGTAMLTGGGSTAAQFLAFAAPTVLLEGGSAYNEIRDKLIEQGVSPEEARVAASGGALATAVGATALERLPFDAHFLFQRVPAARKVFDSAIMRRLATTPISAASEGLEEMGQEAWSMAVEYAMTHDPGAFADWQSRLAAGGALGALAGGVAGATLGGGRTAESRAETSRLARLRRTVATKIDPTLEQERRTAEREAYTDGLAPELGVGNKRAWEAARSRVEADEGRTILASDMNGLKALNDTHGHDAGDVALRRQLETAVQAAEEFGLSARNVFRVGGDEVLIDAPTELADQVAARWEELYGLQDHGDGVRTSLAIGSGADFQAADAALYDRKAAQKAEQGIPGRDEAPQAPPAPTSQSMPTPEDVPVRGEIRRLPVGSLVVSPERLQYKTIDIGEDGVSDALHDVEWDDVLGGVIHVWYNPQDGQTYVVNGHHRHDRARRSGVESMNVQFIDAANFGEARLTGALINIAEDKGSPIDAAKVLRELRDAGVDAESELQRRGVSIRGTIARDGLALSHLPSDLFTRIATGEVPVSVGVAIGGAGLTEAQQRAVWGMAHRGSRRMSLADIEEAARYAKTAGSTTTSEQTLFGLEEFETPLFRTKIELSSWLRRQLLESKRGLERMGREAFADLAEAEEIGQLDASRARDRARLAAQVEEIFTRESVLTGPISNALNDAARRVAEGEKANAVRQELLQTVRDAIVAELRAPDAGRGAPDTGQLRRGGEVRDGEVGPTPEAQEVDPGPSLFGEEPAPPVDTETGDLFGEAPAPTPTDTKTGDLFGEPEPTAAPEPAATPAAVSDREADARQPWEMTRDEFIRAHRSQFVKQQGRRNIEGVRTLDGTSVLPLPKGAQRAGRLTRPADEILAEIHRTQVENQLELLGRSQAPNALPWERAAKPVPDAVLADYPDLSGEPAPAPAAAPAPEIPDRVRRTVERALNELRSVQQSIESGREADRRFGPDGRYEADAYQNTSERREQYERVIEEFRTRARAMGIDPEAVLAEMGGVPDLSISDSAQEWLQVRRERAAGTEPAPAPAAAPAPEVAAAPDPTPEAAPEPGKIVYSKPATYQGRREIRVTREGDDPIDGPRLYIVQHEKGGKTYYIEQRTISGASGATTKVRLSDPLPLREAKKLAAELLPQEELSPFVRSPDEGPASAEVPPATEPTAEPEAPTLPIEVSADDISLDLATRAHEGTSHTPERRAEQVRQEYVQHLQALHDALAPLATTDEARATLAAELEKYRDGYLKRTRAILEAKSRTLNPMVTGRANFPTARNQKALDVETRRVKEMMEWSKKAQAAIRRKLQPERGPISSDDPNAPEVIRQKIAEKEKLQETMVAANRIVRMKSIGQEAKIERLKELGLSEARAKELFEPDFAGRIGFPDYQLTNNRAEIKRLKRRLEEIERRRSETTTEVEFDGGTVVDNVEDNRLQIFFDSKPDADLRKKLKKAGFRWAPSVKAWQRQRGPNANAALQRVLGVRVEGQAEVRERGAQYGGERIAAAAIRTTDGAVYTGPSHGDVWWENRDAIRQTENWTDYEEGFVTSTGRFVTRDEAAEIATRARQTRSVRPMAQGDRPGSHSIDYIDGELPERPFVRERGAQYGADNFRETVRDFAADVKERHGLQSFDLFADQSGAIHLNMIAVPRDARKQGVGSAAMEELVRFADEHGRRITLRLGQRDDAFGTTSSARLRRFYKRFGFVDNRGRNKDYAISADMYRDPAPTAVREAAPQYGARSITDSPAFRRWFGNSKVVDEHGRPLVVYHGTTAEFDTFERRSPDIGFHAGSPEAANAIFESKSDGTRPRPAPLEGRQIMPLYMRIENPLRVRDLDTFSSLTLGPELERLGLVEDGRAWSEEVYNEGVRRTMERWAREYPGARTKGELEAAGLPLDDQLAELQKAANEVAIERLEAMGYDGLVYENRFEGGGDTWVAFRPEQIKSATGNVGTFDPSDPSIVREGAANYNLFGEEEPAPAQPKQGDLFGAPEPSRRPQGLTEAEQEARQIVSVLAGKVGRGTATEAQLERYREAMALLERDQKLKPEDIAGRSEQETLPLDPRVGDLFAKVREGRPLSMGEGRLARQLMREQFDHSFGSEEAARQVAAEVVREAGDFAHISHPALKITPQRKKLVEEAREAAFAWEAATGTQLEADASGNVVPESAFRFFRAFRSPSVEFFTAIVVAPDAEGNQRVTHHRLITSGVLDRALIPTTDIQELADLARQLGGQVIVAHNHPSGNPAPSTADHAATNLIASLVRQHGAKFGGHYVTNHETGYLIHSSADRMTSLQALTVPREAQALNWTDLHGEQLTTPSAILTYFAALPVDATRLDVLLLNTELQVVGLEVRPLATLDEIADWLPILMEETAAHSVVLGTGSGGAFNRAVRAVTEGLGVVDVVDTSSQTSAKLLDVLPKAHLDDIPMAVRLFERGEEYGGRDGEPADLQRRTGTSAEATDLDRPDTARVPGARRPGQSPGLRGAEGTVPLPGSITGADTEGEATQRVAPRPSPAATRPGFLDLGAITSTTGRALRRNFTSAGLLPSEIFERKIARDGWISSQLRELAYTLRDFRAAANEVYGGEHRISDADLELLNDALAGDIPGEAGAVEAESARLRQLDEEAKAAATLALEAERTTTEDSHPSELQRAERLHREANAAARKLRRAREEIRETRRERSERAIAALPEPMQPVIRQMRDQIDALSRRLIDSGAVEGEMVATVEASMGTYLTRSYRVFDDPKWADKVPEDVKNRAKALLRREFPDKSEAQIDGLINELLYKLDDGPLALVRGSKLGSKDLTTLIRRKNISPEIRALWGEYKDPRVNFARSVTKMAHLIANHEFLTDVREQHTGEILMGQAEARPDAFFYPEPITRNGISYHVEIAPEGSEVMAPLNGLYTTPEIAQAFRDVFEVNEAPGWLRAYMKLNGAVKYTKTVGSAMTHVRNTVGNLGFAVANGHWRIGKARDAFSAIMADIGARNDREWRDYYRKLQELGVVDESAHAGELRDAIKDASRRGLDEFAESAIERGAKKTLDTATALYRAEDDVWKVFAFENEVERYSKALPDVPRAEIERRAARIVRNTYPTYSLVPRGIKWVRRFPLLGTFVSFPAEVARTLYNTIELTTEELRDPRLRGIGAERLAGMTMAATGTSAAVIASRFLAGILKDEEDDLREFLPPWSENSDLIHLGRDEDGKYRFIDISYTDPYSYLRKPIMALLRGEDWNEALVDGIAEFFDPYLSEDILAEKLLDISRNQKKGGGRVYNPQDDAVSQNLAKIAHLWNALEPGTISSARRIWMGATGKQTVHGRSYNLGQEISAVVSGFRISELDVPQSLSFRAREVSRGLNDARGVLASVASRRGTVTDAELRRAYETTETSRRRLFRDAYNYAQAAVRLGMTEQEVRRVLASAGFSAAEANLVMSGRYRPYRPGDNFLSGVTASERAVKGSGAEQREAAQEFARRRRLIQRIAAEHMRREREQAPGRRISTTNQPSTN